MSIEHTESKPCDHISWKLSSSFYSRFFSNCEVPSFHSFWFYSPYICVTTPDKGICPKLNCGCLFDLVPSLMYLTLRLPNKREETEGGETEGGWQSGSWNAERPYVLSWRNGVLWAESGPLVGILNDIILEQSAVQAVLGREQRRWIRPLPDTTTRLECRGGKEGEAGRRGEFQGLTKCPELCSKLLQLSFYLEFI